MYGIKKLLLLTTFLSCSLAGYSLEILFSRYSVNDGLSSNFVNCTWQDARGLMWIGTENGLQRYDGSKFIDFYRNSNPKKLPAVPVHQIMGDSKVNMWIVMGRKVGTFNTFNYTFREARVLSSKPIPARAGYYLRRDYKGNMLLTIFKFGIFVYNEKKNAFEENRNEIYVPEQMGIVHAFEDRQTGNYWLSTDEGLALFNYKEKKLYTAKDRQWNKLLLAQPDLLKGVTHFHIDSKRRYWIVSWASGFQKSYCFDEKKGKFTSDTAGINSDKGYFEISNFKESRGILWAYGLHFLKIYDPQEKGFIEFYSSNPNFGIRFNCINHIFEDKEKNVWVATDNGLYVANVIFNQARHGLVTKVHHEDNIISILQTSDSHILFGTWGRGIESLKVTGDIYQSDPEYQKLIYSVKHKQGDPFDMVWDMLEHRRTKSIWLACQEGKLIHYNPQSKQSEFLSPPIFEGRTVRQAEEDLQGNLWFGTQAGKIIKMSYPPSGNKWTFSVIHDLGIRIAKLYVDKKGLLWVGTEGKGLYAINTADSRIVMRFAENAREGSGLSSNWIKDIIQYNDSLYYVASVNLDILDIKNKKVRQLTIYDGLPYTSVSSLQLDISGDLWLSTIGGICTFNMKRNVFREYDQKDGLISTTSSDNLLATSTSRTNNRLIFAGGSYFVDFNPDLIKDRTRPEDVTITDFKLFNNNLPVDSILKLEKLELRNDQNSITIEFASLNYTHSHKLIYYYMLEGADKTWIKTDGPVAANYSFLPAGNYRFKVRSVNSEGIGSKNITSLPIYIKPGFWQTRWFVLLVSVFIAGIIYSAYRIRLNQLLEVQKIRERVARDLHDDMGSTLSTINILSEMARFKVKDNVRSAEDYLVKISDNSVRMMEAMDDIVWSIKPSNDSIQKITARMREFAAGILEPKNIDYSFVLDENIKDFTLNMEARRDLFLIFKESINNLAKYSKAQNACIHFYQKDKKLILKIEDDGQGFIIKDSDSGNGLNNMKKRSEKLKGTLRIKSELNMGTTICLELPLT